MALPDALGFTTTSAQRPFTSRPLYASAMVRSSSAFSLETVMFSVMAPSGQALRRASGLRSPPCPPPPPTRVRNATMSAPAMMIATMNGANPRRRLGCGGGGGYNAPPLPNCQGISALIPTNIGRD